MTLSPLIHIKKVTNNRNAFPSDDFSIRYCMRQSATSLKRTFLSLMDDDQLF